MPAAASERPTQSEFDGAVCAQPALGDTAIEQKYRAAMIDPDRDTAYKNQSFRFLSLVPLSGRFPAASNQGLGLGTASAWLVRRIDHRYERAMEQAIRFEELRWLQELAFSMKKPVPEFIGASLLRRGLIERKPGGFAITAKGRIALAKLG